MNLSIAKNFSLPTDLVTQVEVILAKRRAGKSYTMRRLVEQLLKASQQVVMVDPKGDQWGLRSSADGKKPGFSVLILGGEHGDLPLEVNGGELVARLVVEQRVNVLLDLSQFRKHEIATFMTAFLENLYRLKAQEKYRTPVKLVVDEADAIAPQKPQKGEERMLGAIEDIVRRGGQRGIGCTLVTQRSAVLNKNVLTQAQMLVVLRTIAPQDIAAMKAWIDVHGTVEEGKTLIESLPALPIGDAWFWSPGWPTEEGIFKRVHVLPIETFDSGATPKPGQRRIIPKNLADVDLDALKEQMGATIEKAKENDPKALRAQVAELKGKLADFERKNVQTAAKDTPMGVSQWREYGKKYGYWDFFEKQIMQKAGLEWEKVVKAWIKRSDTFLRTLATIANITEEHKKVVLDQPVMTPPNWLTPSNLEPAIPVKLVPVQQLKQTTTYTGLEKPHVLSAENFETASLKEGARKILHSLRLRHPTRLTRQQVSILVGFKSSGGTFGSYISNLRRAGLIDEQAGMLGVTEAGLQYELNETIPETPEERKEMWRGRFKEGARKMFDVVMEVYPEAITREALGERVGFVASGGTFGSYISNMKTAGVIDVTPEGIRASDNLFS